MKSLQTAVAVVLALLASAALATAPARPPVPPGFAVVTLADEASPIATVPVRFGVEHDDLAPRTVLSFGGDAELPASFAFTLGPAQATGPLPSTVEYLRDQGLDDADIAAFVAVDRDAQLVMLLSPEVIRAALAEGRMPDLDAVEQSIPAEVDHDLRYLSERRASATRQHVAALSVQTMGPDGTLREHHGAGMVEVHFDETAPDDEDVGQARYAGTFWGSYDGAAGPVWVEGHFAGAPFALRSHPLFETVRQGWDHDRDEPQPSRFEALWPEPFPVLGIAVSVPPAWDRLAHHLSVELLLEPGGWTPLADTPLPPPTAETEGPSLADDPEAVAFLARFGTTASQFEHVLALGQGPLLLRSWQAQGISDDDIPPALLERIELAPAPADTATAGQTQTTASEPGWAQRPGGFLSHKALAYALPEPVAARGIRFELRGAPFLGEHWELHVETGPVERSGGDVSHTWRYVHGW